MRRAELVTTIVLALFSIYLMWKSSELDVGYIRGEGPGGGAWPFWLAACMLISTGFIAFNWVRRTSPPSQSEEPLLDRYGQKMLVMVGGGILGFIILVHIISMYGAMFVFLIYYLKILGRHKWSVTLPVAVGTPVIFFYFFEALMRITLPKGMSFLDPVFNWLSTLIY